MGLLSRAESKAGNKNISPETIPLGDMEKSLAEKISRLPLNENTPCTALGLIKAYANFNCGGCLALKDGVYSCFSSLGSRSEKISIPQNEIWSEEKAHLKYFQYNLSQDSGGNSDYNYWIFPIDSQETRPWNSVVLLETLKSAEKSSAFNPQSISEIIAKSSDKLCTYDEVEELDEEDLINEEIKSFKPISKEQRTIKAEIEKFQKAYGNFNCVIFDSSKEDHLDFSLKVSEMVNTLGTVIPLSPARPLILIPITQDCELITHRLSKSFNTTPLISFESDSADNALSRIQPLIEDGSGNEQVFTFQI